MTASGKFQLDEDIDFPGLVKVLWKERRLVYLSVAAFLILGVFIAFGSSEEYTSKVRLLPELKQAPRIGGSLGGLARQFGVMGSTDFSADGIPPDLYPDIARNLVLMTRLLDYEVTVENLGRRLTIYDYFTGYKSAAAVDYVRAWTVHLPFTVRYLIRQRRGDGSRSTPVFTDASDLQKWERILTLSPSQWEVVQELQDRISVDMVLENGVVTISATMPEARMSADVADQVVQFLIDYITDYRTEKARRDLAFITERYLEIQGRFEQAQKKLARFRDENRGQLTEMSRIRQDRLQADFDHTFRLYTNVADRLEEARIKLQEDAPVVNILEPAAVPDRRSSPKRAKILMINIFAGFVFAFGIIFGKRLYRELKEKHGKMYM